MFVVAIKGMSPRIEVTYMWIERERKFEAETREALAHKFLRLRPRILGRSKAQASTMLWNGKSEVNEGVRMYGR
jgi:hypothetical protein